MDVQAACSGSGIGFFLVQQPVLIREVLPRVEGFAYDVVIPEDGQLVPDFKYGIRLRGFRLAAPALDQHHHDAGIRPQSGFPSLTKNRAAI